MDINYNITFHSYWHCGSGLAAGADADLLVIKDKDGLPFVPGKTIKGLVREAFDILYSKDKDTDDYVKAFGTTGSHRSDSFFNVEHVTVNGIRRTTGSHRSDSFFTDATIPKNEAKYISSQDGLTEHFYQTVSSTAITDEGIADNNTLRKIQVCIPCTVEGAIIDVPQAMNEKLQNALKYIKRLGSWRNRGLGRCDITNITFTNE